MRQSYKHRQLTLAFSPFPQSTCDQHYRPGASTLLIQLPLDCAFMLLPTATLSPLLTTEDPRQVESLYW